MAARRVSLLIRERQSPDSSSAGAEDDHATPVKVFLERWKTVENSICELVSLNQVRFAEQNEGRPVGVAERQQSSEVGIGGDEYSVFVDGALQDSLVRRRLYLIFADVHGVMVGIP